MLVLALPVVVRVEAWRLDLDCGGEEEHLQNKGAATTARNSGVYGVLERKIKGKSCWKEREGKGGKELSPGSLAHGLRNSITAFFSPHPDLSLNTAKRFPRSPVPAPPSDPANSPHPQPPSALWKKEWHPHPDLALHRPHPSPNLTKRNKRIETHNSHLQLNSRGNHKSAGWLVYEDGPRPASILAALYTIPSGKRGTRRERSCLIDENRTVSGPLHRVMCMS